MTNPHGVSLQVKSGKYRAEYKSKYLGSYETSDEAEVNVLHEKRSRMLSDYSELCARMVELACVKSLEELKTGLAKED